MKTFSWELDQQEQRALASVQSMWQNAGKSPWPPAEEESDESHAVNVVLGKDQSFDTQLGKGDVRGWCQQYKADNTPARARHFEGAVIEPRCFNRFMSPMLSWFYGMTGKERYCRLLEESYCWLKAQEHPDDNPLGGGWAYQYLPDGTEVSSHEYKVYHYDKPESWPEGVKAFYDRFKVQLTDTELVLAQLKSGGLEALRQWYRGPKKYSLQEPSRCAWRRPGGAATRG